MNNISAALLDKDGTLIDFQSYWIPVSEAMIRLLVGRLELDDASGAIQRRLLQSIGIEGTTVVPGTPVASGTGKDVADALFGSLSSGAPEVSGNIDSPTIRQWMNLDYQDIAPQYESYMTPYPGAREAIERLAAEGLPLGVATADSTASARYALEKLGLEKYFVFTGGSDSVRAHKPDPELARLFCESVSVEPDRVAMVGDTPVDMAFARNAGMTAVAVLTGVGTRDELEPLADVVIESVADLADLLLPGVDLP